jgi:hypothetical protein
MRGVERCEDDVLVVSVDRLVSVLRIAARVRVLNKCVSAATEAVVVRAGGEPIWCHGRI